MQARPGVISVAPLCSALEIGQVAPDTKSIISVQVRELVEFALRSGDLGHDRDFVGRHRALAGTRGHQRVQRSRGLDYRKEVRVSYQLDAGEFTLRIQGRIDGLQTTGTEVLLEEIKTVQGSDGETDPLHWAQASLRFYLCAPTRARRGPNSLQLTWTWIGQSRRSFTSPPPRGSVRVLRRSVTIYVGWSREQWHWRQERNRSIGSLAFPFERYRPGQREMAVAVYRAVGGGRLFLEAPTGIGKTVSVLFPALKAMGEGRIDRLFYLTARTPGRSVVEKTIAELRSAGGCEL